jgi:large subunit ribosomal protein L29
MAKKAKQNLSDLSTEDLIKITKQERFKYNKVKFNHAVSPIENPISIRLTRRNIARFLTELNKRK